MTYVDDSFNVSILMDQSPFVQDVYSPEGGFMPTANDRPGAALAMLSSRREFWEVHVLSLGFAQQVGGDPVLAVAELGALDFWPDDHPFAAYCTETGFSVSRDVLQASARVLTLVGVNVQRAALEINPAKLEYCLLRDGSREDVLRCLQES